MEQTSPRLSDLKETIKALNLEKQLCAKQFKEIDKTSSQFLELKEKMTAISSQLKKLDATRKKIINGAATPTDNATALSPCLPSRLTYKEVNDKSLCVRICESKNSDQAEWDQYIENHPLSCAYHLYSWRNVISVSFDHQASYLIAKNSLGDIVGILPIIWQSSRLFGNHGISIPYFNYGGVLSDNKKIDQQLLDHAIQLCSQRKYSDLEFRDTRTDIDLPSIQHKVSMLLSLPKNEKTLDQQLGAKVRSQINQSQKFNLQCKIGKQELLRDFYKVFSQNMRDLGTPVYSKRFFKEIFIGFSKNAHIVILYQNQKPISTAFLIGHKETLEIPWASTLRKFNHTNANMLLYRNILGFAIRNKFDFFDFGRSSPDSGTYRFKKQWGAKPVQLNWHYWLDGGSSLPQINPNNPKYRLLISCWKKLPVFLSNFIGPFIAKNLP